VFGAKKWLDWPMKNQNDFSRYPQLALFRDFAGRQKGLLVSLNISPNLASAKHQKDG